MKVAPKPKAREPRQNKARTAKERMPVGQALRSTGAPQSALGEFLDRLKSLKSVDLDLPNTGETELDAFFARIGEVPRCLTARAAKTAAAFLLSRLQEKERPINWSALDCSGGFVAVVKESLLSAADTSTPPP